MAKSLQDQFLKLGLVDKKKHNQTKKERHTKKTAAEQQKNEIAEMAKQGLAEKKKRDKQLNKKKIAQRQAKEATAQARQLIETHKIDAVTGDIAYNFKDENTVKKILLNQPSIDSLAKGKLGIVKLAGEYHLVPAKIIYKIRSLNKKLVILLNSPGEEKNKSDDDPYAEYEIPDDLMW